MKIIPRKKYTDKIFPFMKKGIIKAIIGLRRSGKSYLLRQIQNEIISNEPDANIIYINKELYEFEFIQTGKDLFEYIKAKLTKNFNYVFIDEVQEIKEFERALRDLYSRSNIDIYITGSNAVMLSGELSTFLSGRYIEIKVYPLSFSEFLIFHNLENNNKSLDLYLKYGGMPYLSNLELADDLTNPYLKSIYDTVLLKDVVAKYNIRNVEFLIRLTKYLAENTGNIISAKKISDYLKNQKINIPPNTIINYINALTSTFLVNKVSRQNIDGKKVFEVNEKYYYEDVGLRNTLIGFRPHDISKILENVVYNHLKSSNYDVKIGIISGKEIDFIANKQEETVYIQVAYLLPDEKVIEREFNNLLSIKDNYRKFVVSLDEFPVGNYKGIEHLHLREFLNGFE